jgi:hypothetical protein
MTGWTEVRLARLSSPADFYAWLDDHGSVDHLHHFWDEPWWPSAFVVRLLNYEGSDLAECQAVDHQVTWDVTEDEELYGDTWPLVKDLFQAQSRLAAEGESLWTSRKLVHCFLNSRGYDNFDEFKFHGIARKGLRKRFRKEGGRLFWAWKGEQDQTITEHKANEVFTPGLAEVRA